MPKKVAASRPALAALASLCVLLGALAVTPSALAAAPEAPVTLTPATEITATSATLSGELNPGASAKVTWQMFLSNPGGSSCHEGITVGGEGPLEGQAIPVSTTPRDLEPSSVYRYCVVAFNGEGETSGNEGTFKTLGAPGTPELSVAKPVGAAEATFEAVLRPEGEVGTHEPWPYHFLYKPGSSCAGGTETHFAVSGGEPDETVTAEGFALTPDTTYALCLVVTTVSETTTYGPISFTTHNGVALTVHLTGEGTVESSPSGITCETEQCFHVFEGESTVKLTATPKSGYVLAGWLGCQQVILGACEVAPPARTEVTAVFLKSAEKGEKGEEGKVGKEGPSGKEGTPGKEGASGKEGAPGTGGAAGATGPAGPIGPAGPAGPQGKEGPPGKIELVKCTKHGGKQHCTTKLVSGTFKVTAASAASAALSRHGVTYAVGSASRRSGRMSLRLRTLLPLAPGRYTLALSRRVRGHTTTTYQPITIT